MIRCWHESGGPLLVFKSESGHIECTCSLCIHTHTHTHIHTHTHTHSNIEPATLPPPTVAHLLVTLISILPHRITTHQPKIKLNNNFLISLFFKPSSQQTTTITSQRHPHTTTNLCIAAFSHDIETNPLPDCTHQKQRLRLALCGLQAKRSIPSYDHLINRTSLAPLHHPPRTSITKKIITPEHPRTRCSSYNIMTVVYFGF